MYETNSELGRVFWSDKVEEKSHHNFTFTGSPDKRESTHLSAGFLATRESAEESQWVR